MLGPIRRSKTLEVLAHLPLRLLQMHPSARNLRLRQLSLVLKVLVEEVRASIRDLGGLSSLLIGN